MLWRELTGCHNAEKVMPILNRWTVLPAIHIINPIIIKFFTGACAASQAFCIPKRDDSLAPPLAPQQMWSKWNNRSTSSVKITGNCQDQRETCTCCFQEASFSFFCFPELLSSWKTHKCITSGLQCYKYTPANIITLVAWDIPNPNPNTSKQIRTYRISRRTRETEGIGREIPGRGRVWSIVKLHGPLPRKFSTSLHIPLLKLQERILSPDNPTRKPNSTTKYQKFFSKNWPAKIRTSRSDSLDRSFRPRINKPKACTDIAREALKPNSAGVYRYSGIYR